MARLRYNGLTATLGADLLTAGTTITFDAALASAAGAVPTISGSDYIPLVLLDASGGVVEIVHLTAYTSGATTGTVTRAQESTTATDHLAGVEVVHAPTIADFSTTTETGLLAAVTYNPGTSADLTTTSTTDVDADATNLAVTFTVPASGKVLVRLTALGEQPATSAGVWWTIRQGTTTVRSRYVTTARVTDYDYPGNAAFLITGLTAGASITYKWGHYTTSGGTSKIRVGGILGPAVMEVWAAP